MNKERLEEIKEDYELRHLRGYEWISIPKRNFNWLLSTVEEQQKEIEHLKENEIYALSETLRQECEFNRKLEKENARLQKSISEYKTAEDLKFKTMLNDQMENTRLRAALQRIATYRDIGIMADFENMKKIARQALKGEST